MIVDTMTKLEVMKAIRKDFDDNVYPYYEKKIRPQLQALIQPRAQRENKIISLGTEIYKTSFGLDYNIRKRGDAYGEKIDFYVEFSWRNKRCFASFFKNGGISVYQPHCLERYAERVIGYNMGNRDILTKYILKNQDAAFQIVLPSPTHQSSSCLVMANALFLGDFDAEQIGMDKFSAHWYNTCISAKECHHSQGRIMDELASLQKDILTLGYNPVNQECRNKYRAERRHLMKNHRETLTHVFSTIYMLFILQRSFRFPFYNKVEEEINGYLSFIENELNKLGVNAKYLDPYDKQNGVARRGELDYDG